MATATETLPVGTIELPTRTNSRQGPKPSAVGADNNHVVADEPPREAKHLYIQLISVGFSFFVAGVNDGSIGALLPYIIREYHVSTAIVSSVYGANFVGWLSAALTNTHLTQYLDGGALLALGAFCQVVAQALRCWDPPFALFVCTFWIVSIGQALQDTQGNTFVAGAKNAHRWLAFIHSMYAAGCLLGPFVSTAIASAGTTSRWYLFYTFPLAIGVANVALVLVAFRDTIKIRTKAPPATPHASQTAERGALHGSTSSADSDDPASSRNMGAVKLIRATMSTPSVWLLCLFFFFYLGSALTASGWVVEYLVQVRHGKLSQMGYVPAGFNGGVLLGRLLLAEPTNRLGERRMVFAYCLIALVLQIVFWLVPNIIAASIAVSLIGFFTGPLFATGISLGSKLFPPEIHSSALALVFVFAQMGGSLFPIVTGVISSNVGVKVLQPILVGLLAATGITWLLVPRPKTAGNPGLHEE